MAWCEVIDQLKKIVILLHWKQLCDFFNIVYFFLFKA